MTRGSSIALRWARALYGLAGNVQEASSLCEQLSSLTDLVTESPELQRVLWTPIHPRKERRAVIGELCEALSVSPELRAFAMMLVEENRVRELPAILAVLSRMVDEAAGRLVAEITSARALGQDELEQLRQALSSRVHTDVTLETRVDPDLIGGVVARVGGLLLDGSVRTQLAHLSDNLRRG